MFKANSLIWIIPFPLLLCPHSPHPNAAGYLIIFRKEIVTRKGDDNPTSVCCGLDNVRKGFGHNIDFYLWSLLSMSFLDKVCVHLIVGLIDSTRQLQVPQRLCTFVRPRSSYTKLVPTHKNWYWEITLGRGSIQIGSYPGAASNLSTPLSQWKETSAFAHILIY